MDEHKIVSPEEWLATHKAFLAKEKEFTKLRNELARERRALPWTKVTKNYVFEGARGKEALSDLFDGRSQLVVYHFMFDPDWDAGCKHCSFWADNFNPNIVHLNDYDISMVAVSRAPYAKIAAYEKRMGWTFKWLSSFGSDFNFDFHVSFTPEQRAQKSALYNFILGDPGIGEREGASVFCKNAKGEIFHTYSTFARGIDLMNAAYNWIDVTPRGRHDEAEKGNQFWIKRHDEY